MTSQTGLDASPTQRFKSAVLEAAFGQYGGLKQLAVQPGDGLLAAVGKKSDYLVVITPGKFGREQFKQAMMEIAQARLPTPKSICVIAESIVYTGAGINPLRLDSFVEYERLIALAPGRHGTQDALDSHLPPGQDAQTNFLNFVSGTKVVDEDGKPLVVYHGTSPGERRGMSFGDIHVFDRMASVTIVGRPPSIDLVGSWFSTNPSAYGAEAYGSTIYPVYLSIKNPHVTTFAQMVRRARMLVNKKDDGRTIGIAEVDAYRRWLSLMGNDGIRIVHDHGRQHESLEFLHQDAWIALEPNQIKSAIGNSGAFDPRNPSITDAPEFRPAMKCDELQHAFGQYSGKVNRRMPEPPPAAQLDLFRVQPLQAEEATGQTGRPHLRMR